MEREGKKGKKEGKKGGKERRTEGINSRIECIQVGTWTSLYFPNAVVCWACSSYNI